MHKDYYLWLTGTTADQLAKSVKSLVLPLIVVSITGNVTNAGFLGTVCSSIFALFAIFGGVVVDRIDRRHGMYARAGIGAVTWFIATILLAQHILTYEVLFVLAVIAALSEALFSFADDAALRSIVTDNKEFAKTQSVNQGRQAVIGLIGGPIGGLIYALIPWSPFALSAAALTLLGITAFAITTNLSTKSDQTSPQEDTTQEAQLDEHAEASMPVAKKSIMSLMAGVCKDIAAGFTFVFGDKTKRAIAIGGTFINFAAGLIPSIVMYSLIQQHYSAFEISLVEVALAVGMLIGAPLSSIVMQKIPTGLLCIGSFIVLGIDFFAFALFPNYYCLFAWYAITGIVIPLISAPMLGYFYAKTPIEMQGRSASIMTVTCMGLSAFAPLTASILVSHNQAFIGTVMAAVLMLLVGLLFMLVPSVRSIGLPDHWADEE